jgi:hypothetical protein
MKMKRQKSKDFSEVFNLLLCVFEETIVSSDAPLSEDYTLLLYYLRHISLEILRLKNIRELVGDKTTALSSFERVTNLGLTLNSQRKEGNYLDSLQLSKTEQ